MVVEFEDVGFVFAIALLHAYQLGEAARTVAEHRNKYKIKPPEMNGPGDFMRAVRAQQNDLEFSLPFQIVLWSTGICFHQIAAVIFGLMYLYGRRSYKLGYVEEADKRLPGFYTSMRALKIMIALSVVGLACLLLRQYADVDIGAIVRKQFHQTTGIKLEL